MKTFVINNKYKIKANDAVEATRIACMIESVKDSKIKDFNVERQVYNAATILDEHGVSYKSFDLDDGTITFNSLSEAQRAEKILAPRHFKIELIKKYIQFYDSVKDEEMIRTPRGTFKISSKPYHQLQEEGWGFWFDYADLYYDGKGPWYKIMHNSKTNQAVAVIYKVLRDSAKDAKPVKVISTHPATNNYIILEIAFSDGSNAYMVVKKDNYHGEKEYAGGGTVEFNLNKAIQTAKDYEIMEQLNKKYGEKEGYKKWMKGETDSVKDAAMEVTKLKPGQKIIESGITLTVLSIRGNASSGFHVKVQYEDKTTDEWFFLPHEKVIVDSVKDNDEEDLEFLTEEEKKAVEEYKEAIAGTTNPKLLELYKHILEDEMEHIQELQEGEVKDSI